jgi:hypothetical protein
VLQNEIPDATNVLGAEAAKRHGARVILNAAPARALDPLLAPHVDVLVVNAVEAEMMSGIAVGSLDAAAEAAAQLSSQANSVIVTAGGLGLALAEEGRRPQVDAAHRVNLVDTHGAGDAFIGALDCSPGRRGIATGSRALRQCRGRTFCQHTGRAETISHRRSGYSIPLGIRSAATAIGTLSLTFLSASHRLNTSGALSTFMK